MSTGTPASGSIGSRVLVNAAAFVIIVAGMRTAAPILVPMLLALFVAVMCVPAMLWLEAKRFPKGLALSTVAIGVAILGFVVVAVVGESLDGFAVALPDYLTRLREEEEKLVTWLGAFGIELSNEVVLKYLDPRAAMRFGANILSGLGGVLTDTFIILIAVIFMLLEASGFPAKLRAISRDPHASVMSLNKFMSDFKRYMAIKTSLSLATGFAITLWLSVLGVDFPILWGLLAFLLNYVPNIGSIIAAVPAILLALVQLGSGSAVAVGVGYLVVNTVFGTVMEPRFMGHRLGLSTLVVFLSLFFWGWVLGPVGMLLSVPLTMTVKIALESRTDTQWIAVLLGSEVAGERPGRTADK